MNFENILYSLPGVIAGLTVHEFFHAWAAFKLGDVTAREEGRLSFNPLRHIDIIGFLFIVFAGFGWAKPVRFSPENLRHPRRDKAIIAAAGPASNFILALVFIMLIKAYQYLVQYLYMSGEGTGPLNILGSEFFDGFIIVILRAAAINLGLFIFNLLPLPPLDGSHIFFSGLNLRPETEYRIMKIGAPILFIIIIIESRTNLDIIPVGRFTMAVLSFFLPELRAS